MKNKINSKYLQYLGLAVNVFPGSEGWLCPALFTAITRNWYSFPSINPCTIAVGEGVVVSIAFSHRGLYLSFISIMYPVIGDPPSDGGSDHLSST